MSVNYFLCVHVFSYYWLFLGHKATLLPVSPLWELQCSQPTSRSCKAAVFRKCKGTLWTLFPRMSHAEWSFHTNNKHLPMFFNMLARLFSLRDVQLPKSRRWPHQTLDIPALRVRTTAMKLTLYSRGQYNEKPCFQPRGRKIRRLNILTLKTLTNLHIFTSSKTDFLILGLFPVRKSIILPHLMGLVCHQHTTVNCVTSQKTNSRE